MGTKQSIAAGVSAVCALAELTPLEGYELHVADGVTHTLSSAVRCMDMPMMRDLSSRLNACFRAGCAEHGAGDVYWNARRSFLLRLVAL